VVARYNAHFSGYANHDPRAVWVDWHNLRKVRGRHPECSINEFAELIGQEVESTRALILPENYAFPIQDLGIIVNPTEVPHGLSSAEEYA